MPLAISNILWPSSLDDEAMAVAGQAGADGIEVAPTRIAPWNKLTVTAVREYRRRLEAMGLAIPSLQAVLFECPDACLLGDLQSYRNFSDHLSLVAEYAAEMGASRMVFGAPKNRRRGSLLPADAMNLAVERLRPVAERIHSHGVMLAVEAVPPDYGCDFINTATEAADLVRRVSHPGVRLHLDAGALTMAHESAEEIVSAHADILAHVHVSRPGLVAVTGQVPMDSILAGALMRARYGGWISIEIAPQDDPLACIPRALAVVRAAYAGAL